MKRVDPKIIKNKTVKVTADQLMGVTARLQAEKNARQDRINPFEVRKDIHPPRATPKTGQIAQDSNIAGTGVASISAWAGAVISTSFSEGLQFLGYGYLSELAQRPEYRVISGTIAEEMTRKWIKFESVSDSGGEDDAEGAAEKTGPDDGDDEDPADADVKKAELAAKTKRIKELTDEFERLEVQDNFRRIAEQDGYFGRSHLYLDLGTTKDRDELKSPIGNGQNEISKAKVAIGSLKRIKTVEAVWCYPTNYDSIDPLDPAWYKPEHWFVMGKELHVSRLLTFVGREVPDMLKPAYSFGGLALSQMVKPYVDNWLQTRQAVNDLIQAFTVWVVSTNLGESLQQGGDALFNRLALFTVLKNNKGVMALDKDTEDFQNVSTSLGTLDQLQAQAQEHMAAVSRIPLVKLLGISPHGLNASSEGEIRVFYDTIHAYQKSFFSKNLTRLMHFVMLSLWGEIDPTITFTYEPLWSLDEKQQAEIREIEARTGTSLIEGGVIDAAEERKRIAEDPDTPYQGIDPDDVPEPPEPPPGQEGGEGGGKPPGGAGNVSGYSEGDPASENYDEAIEFKEAAE